MQAHPKPQLREHSFMTVSSGMAASRGLSLGPRFSFVGTLLALIMLALSGCDSPVCVFADGCTGTGGNGGGPDPNSLGSAAAAFPTNGSVMTGQAPVFVGAGPGGDAASTATPETPIFLEFSESLNASSLFDAATGRGAFRVIDFNFQIEYPMQPPILVGDGRVVVLLPVQPFQEGNSYQVFFGEDQAITDLNGQTILEPTPDALLQLFIDSSTVENTPRLIYAYPPDMSVNRQDTSEIVIGFDRNMDASTIDNASFDVMVGGAAPAFNPVAQPIGTVFMGQTIDQPSVFTWSPIDGGILRPYGVDSAVVVRLSQNNEEILSEEGDLLPPSETEFRTLDFSLPATLLKAPGSRPQGAFGRADVFGSAPIVEVTMDVIPPGGTEADFFLFGQSPVNDGFLKAITRTVAVPAGVLNFTVTSDELQLFDASGDVQFADGIAQVAVQLRNGGSRTSARRFDADPSTPEIEDPTFDTTPPVLLGLGASGANTATLASDVRDFAAFGRASEPIAFAYVDAGMSGTNGGSLADPPRTAFSTPSLEADEAFFIAAPIPVGVLDPNGAGLDYEVTIFDEAFNAASLTAMGTFRHQGVVGPGAVPTGSTVAVTVLNAHTFEPVMGALVLSHQESGGVVSFNASAMSDANGLASVAGAGGGNTVITVDAAGFDLFTFHGVPRNAVQILLEPANAMAARVSGQVVGAFQSGLTATDNVLIDTRNAATNRFSAVTGCTPTNGFTSVRCSFGPVQIRPGTLGAATALGTNENITQATFNPAQYLLTFALAAPFGPVAAGENAMGAVLDVGSALIASSVAAFPVATPLHTFGLGNTTGFGAIDGDPVVVPEAIATGLSSSLVVGRAKSFALGGNTWSALGAIPGVASAAGALAGRGAIDPDLRLFGAATDMAGNVVGARPRLSTSGGALTPEGVPLLLVPGPGGMTGAATYNLVIADAVPDSTGLDAIYRVTLEDQSGRGWTLVGLDTNDGAGDIVLSLPDIAAQGGTPLADGVISATITMYGLILDRGLFLWTDVEREYELFGRTATITFSQN